MIRRTLTLITAALPITAAAITPPIEIQSGALKVTLDPEFPRIINYQSDAGTIAGQTSPTDKIELNGQPTVANVSLAKKSASSAIYTCTFPKENVSMTLQVTVAQSADSVEMKVSGLKESGSFKVHDFSFPNNSLLTASAANPNAELAFAIWDIEYTWGPETLNWMPGGHYRGVTKEEIAKVTDLKPSTNTGTYLFLSDGTIAGGIASSNYSARKRTQRTITQQNGTTTCEAQNPLWEVRSFDDESPELPWVKIFITADRNGDGKINWQDAALVYRNAMPKPLGHQFVKSTVAESIAMNFASGAQQPFLKILDEIKRCHLATDGLGQQVLIKGFSSEGHDSANTDYADHWNQRAGGLNDLNILLKHAREWNARVGIHINTSEFYPESHRFSPKSFDCTASGIPRNGWCWLDQSVMINQVEDFRHGTAMACLDKMHQQIPNLDFVYVDTFLNNGWPARQLARKINGLGLPLYTECPSSLDPWSVWIHSRGGRNAIVQFIWFSDRDMFGNDPILRGGRADDDGFMGWQNRHNFLGAIRNTFHSRLPSKFLQHFDLLRWEPGKSAGFSDDVNVTKDGNTITVTQQNRKIMQWDAQCNAVQYLIPWDITTTGPKKLYAWNETDDTQPWELPPSWKSLKNVYLYQLSDRGRLAESMIPVVDGKISLRITKSTPYVIYQKSTPPTTSPTWGQASHLENPGFDSHSTVGWHTSGTCSVTADDKGNPRLIVGHTAFVASQSIKELEKSTTYAATVWVQTTGTRKASLEVTSGGKTSSNFTNLCNVRHTAPNDARNGSYYQRLRVIFTTTSNPSATITLKAEAGDPSSTVEFDDARIVVTQVSAASAKHYFWEDFEHVESGGYGPFTCCGNENTHLSESNPPFTHDVIAGRFSLKTRGTTAGRTLPCTLRLKPNTHYKVSCQTLGKGRLTATSGGKKVMELPFESIATGSGVVDPRTQGIPECYTPHPLVGTFRTTNDTESFLSLFKDGGDFIAIDNLAIDQVDP